MRPWDPLTLLRSKKAAGKRLGVGDGDGDGDGDEIGCWTLGMSDGAPNWLIFSS